MAWMKVDHWLPNKPELVKIQRATGLTQPGVIGSLVLVWIWFSEHSVDGALEAEPGDLDIIAQHEGFAAAMLKAGWLVSDGQRLSMPGFDKWLGSALEARQRAQQRAGKGGVGNLSATVADIAPTEPNVSPTVGSQTQTETHTQTQTHTQTNPFSAEPEGGATERAENSGDGAPEKIRIEAWAGVIPVPLRAAGFPQEWEAWLLYKRKQFRKPVSQSSGEALLDLLLEVGPVIATRALKQARAGGWTAPDLTKFKQAKDRAQISRAVPGEIYRGPCCSVCGHHGWPREDGACEGCKRTRRDGREPMPGAASVNA